ncbi:MAG TPA: Fe-Mn family superoxide dismutase [Parachlamydiaceae bacterium]|nr:Fe-Mn family superoxide dismutase [Parachlamydiaceae bacterium]
MKNSMIGPTLLSLGLCLQGLQAAEPETKQETKSAVAATTNAKYQVKNFNHLIGNITGLDDSLLKMHLKLYEGYVNNTNIIMDKIQVLATTGQSRTPEFAALKRLVGWEFDGMLLHEYYFENLGGKTALETNDPLYVKMQQDFGSYDQWRLDFVSTGMMRGIGWVVAYIEPKNGRLVNEWINEHDLGHLAGATPILIMDVFEHAYITQFALDRNKYIDVFFNNIDWKTVSERYKDVNKSALAK